MNVSLLCVISGPCATYILSVIETYDSEQVICITFIKVYGHVCSVYSCKQYNPTKVIHHVAKSSYDSTTSMCMYNYQSNYLSINIKSSDKQQHI